MVDCFNIACTIRPDMKDAFGYNIPNTVLTDSVSVFKEIVKSTTTTEKRLMIDFRVTCEVFENNEISNLGWIRPGENTADGLTKPGRYKALRKQIKTGFSTTKNEQLITLKEEVAIEKTNNIEDTTLISKETGLRM